MVDFEDDIKRCMQVLAAGGVILYPTDTIWGLGCDALNAAAVDAVFAIKQRPKEKSMIVLLAEARDVLQYVAAPHPDIIDLLSQFTQPTTVVYEHALEFPENVVHADGSVAIRVTNDPFCKALIKRYRRPIISTSANISGAPPPHFFKEIDPALVNAADYVVRFRQDDTTPRTPSRIVRISDEGEIISLR